MAIAAHYLEIIDRENLPVEGESEGHDHEDEIDIRGWNWDVTDQSAAKIGASEEQGSADSSKASTGDAEVGVEPSIFKFSKAVDSSTTRLMRAMHRGEVLKMATFTLLEELVGVKQEHRGAFRLHVVLENVIVVSYHLRGSSAEHRVDLDEDWELSYAKITFMYETEQMNAEFDRNPGSNKRPAERPPLDFPMLLKKYGIQPERKRKGQRE
jgi:type VI protein secretion system component Hcp